MISPNARFRRPASRVGWQQRADDSTSLRVWGYREYIGFRVRQRVIGLFGGLGIEGILTPRMENQLENDMVTGFI